MFISLDDECDINIWIPDYEYLEVLSFTYSYMYIIALDRSGKNVRIYALQREYKFCLHNNKEKIDIVSLYKGITQVVLTAGHIKAKIMFILH